MKNFCNRVWHNVQFVTTSLIPEPSLLLGTVFIGFEVVVNCPVDNCSTDTFFEIKFIEYCLVGSVFLCNNRVEFFDNEVFALGYNMRPLRHGSQIHSQLLLRNQLIFRELCLKTFLIHNTSDFEQLLLIAFSRTFIIPSCRNSIFCRRSQPAF